MTLCKYAQRLQNHGLTDDPKTPSRTAAFTVGMPGAKTSVTAHRKNACACTTDAPAPEASRGRCEYGPEGGEFTDVTTAAPLALAADWDAIFRKFNLDPAEFVILDDTVRCSTWQQSARASNGDRDTVQLYAYKARFARKQAGAADVASLIESIREWEAPAQRVTRPGEPVSLIVGMADFQLGKGEGDGTKGTLARLEHSLASITAHVDQLQADGVPLEHLVLANMGDHTEGVQGSYSSQTHQADLNTRDQIKLALEVNMQWIKALAPKFERTTYAACLCNHGQLARGTGRDNVTDDADNATGLIGDTLRMVCDLHEDLANIEWVVPREEMITTFNASGVNIAAAHGHKISGKEEAWLASQSLMLTHTKGFTPDLWFTAHRHSAAVNDYGPYSRIQATTVDPGSKWYTDQTGMYSRPGVTTFLAGKSIPGKWDKYTIH